MSPEAPAADLVPTSNVEMVGETPKAAPQVDPMEMMRQIPFVVQSRSRAQKLAKLLYGPLARVWVRKDAKQIEVGTEQGAEKKKLAEGKDFSEAFKIPTETYIKGGLDYEDTRKRIRTVSSFCNPLCFIEDALTQFPEYQNAKKAEQEKAIERMKKVLQKGQELLNQTKPAVVEANV